jgi:DNA modification methylase
MKNNWITADVFNVFKKMPPKTFDLVIADPPYSAFPLINNAVKEARRVSKGASIFFMYAEDLCHLETPPYQILFWTKPISTKNTTKKYSRFVEVICIWDLEDGPYNRQHWANHTGIFTDALTSPKTHEYEKPITLIERLIRIHSNEGDKVLDLFAGSGATRKAAIRTQRNSTSVEIDPKLKQTQ